MPTLNESGVLKLPNEERKPGGTRTQNPNRARRAYVKPSVEDAAKKAVERTEARERFDAAVLAASEKIWDIMVELHDEVPQHTADWFYSYMMQQPKYTGHKRAISQWQAFVAIEADKKNQAIRAEFGENAPRIRASDKEFSAELKARWAKVPQEERDLLNEKVQELEARRADRATGVRNLPLAQFTDVRETVDALVTDMQNLHERTSVEIFAMVVRGKITAYNKPVIHYSSERVKKFFETIGSGTLWDIACRLEACCIGGIDEMVTTQAEKTLLLKAQLAALIMAKMKNACRRGVPRRMYYGSFDAQITAKHGVIVENWPIPKFDNPSHLSHLEVEVVLRSFESGATRFRSLSDSEWTTWRNQYYDVPVPGGLADDAPATEDAPATPVSQHVASTAPDNLPITPIAATPNAQQDESSAGSAAPPVEVSSGEKRPAEQEPEGGARKKIYVTEHAPPLATNFVNSGPPAEGAAFAPPVAKPPVAKAATAKKRQQRSDKGKRRTKKTPGGTENITAPMSETTPATQEPPRPKPKPRAVRKTTTLETTASTSPVPSSPLFSAPPSQAASSPASVSTPALTLTVDPAPVSSSPAHAPTAFSGFLPPIPAAPPTSAFENDFSFSLPPFYMSDAAAATSYDPLLWSTGMGADGLSIPDPLLMSAASFLTQDLPLPPPEGPPF